MLSSNQLHKVCLLNQGSEECRFLGRDDNDPSKCMCFKLHHYADHIDALVENYIDDMEMNGQDPYLIGRPIGDNCKGYLPLSVLPQGYDIKP